MNAPLRHRLPVQIPGEALPHAVLRALNAIADDLRHMPRECIGGKAELVFWLNRQARRIDGVKAMRVPKPPTPIVRAIPKAVSDVERVFGVPVPRLRRTTIITRKGRRVAVEVRKARAAGQIEMKV